MNKKDWDVATFSLLFKLNMNFLIFLVTFSFAYEPMSDQAYEDYAEDMSEKMNRLFGIQPHMSQFPVFFMLLIFLKSF